MSEKSSTVPFDITKMMPAFSNWAFAEREDRLEEKTFAGLPGIKKDEYTANEWEQQIKSKSEHKE